MVFFLHSILTSDDGIQSTNLYNQLLLFRYFAYGSYKDLVQKICMDNGMLDYLDGRKSKKNNPTENFPRELLELFTIGKGAKFLQGIIPPIQNQTFRRRHACLQVFVKI